MDCKMHLSQHLLCGAQGYMPNAQTDYQELEDGKTYRAIFEDVEGFEAASQRRETDT